MAPPSTTTDAPTLRPLCDQDRDRLRASRESSAIGLCALGVVLLIIGLVLFFRRLDSLLTAVASAVIPLALAAMDGVLVYLLVRGNRLIEADLRLGQKQVLLEEITKKRVADEEYWLVAGKLHFKVAAEDYHAAQIGQRWELHVAPRSKVVLQWRRLKP